MRVVCVRGGFGLERLALEERPDPVPEATQVLVRVRAASLNFRDLSIARGTYDPKLPLPLVLGSDALGEVVGRGSAAKHFELGERVCPCFAPGWHAGPPTRETTRRTLGGPLSGTFSELIVADEADLVRPPVHLGDEEAATLGCAGVTAYRALFELAALAPGQRVLVIGTGGVSTFAMLLARTEGAEVIVVSRSAAKLARARALANVTGIDSSAEPEWGLAVRRLTDGAGVDVVVEVGGAATLAQSLRAVRAGGTVALIGHTPDGPPTPSLVPVVMRELRVQGVLVGPRTAFEAFTLRLAESGVHPVLDRVYSLEEHRAAFERLASGDAFGKVVLRVTPP